MLPCILHWKQEWNYRRGNIANPVHELFLAQTSSIFSTEEALSFNSMINLTAVLKPLGAPDDVLSIIEKALPYSPTSPTSSGWIAVNHWGHNNVDLMTTAMLDECHQMGVRKSALSWTDHPSPSTKS